MRSNDFCGTRLQFSTIFRQSNLGKTCFFQNPKAQFLFRNNLVSGRRTSASGFNRIQNKELTLPDAID